MLTRIDKMHALYGVRQGLRCACCPHLVRVDRGSRYCYKCKAYGTSASAASDWRKSWTACKLLGEKLPEVEAAKIPVKSPAESVDEALGEQIKFF